MNNEVWSEVLRKFSSGIIDTDLVNQSEKCAKNLASGNQRIWKFREILLMRSINLTNKGKIERISFRAHLCISYKIVTIDDKSI